MSQQQPLNARGPLSPLSKSFDGFDGILLVLGPEGISRLLQLVAARGWPLPPPETSQLPVDAIFSLPPGTPGAPGGGELSDESIGNTLDRLGPEGTARLLRRASATYPEAYRLATNGIQPAANGQPPATTDSATNGIQPAANGVPPGANGIQPAANGQPPATTDSATNGIQPAANGQPPATTGPGATGVPPGANVIQPAANGVPPGANGIQPAANGQPPATTDSATNGIQPAANGQPPATTGPGATGVPPGANVIQPAANGVPPGANGIQPAANGPPPAATVPAAINSSFAARSSSSTSSSNGSRGGFGVPRPGFYTRPQFAPRTTFGNPPRNVFVYPTEQGTFTTRQMFNGGRPQSSPSAAAAAAIFGNFDVQRFASSYAGGTTNASPGGAGAFRSSAGPRPSTSYQRVHQPYTLASMNQHQPNPEHGRFDCVGFTYATTGSEDFGAPTKSARIRKLELNGDFVYVLDTESNRQKVSYLTLEANLLRALADASFSITSRTENHQPICRVGAWTHFLKPVRDFTLDGWVTAALIALVFPRLPKKTLRSMFFVPHKVAIDMPADEAIRMIPNTIRILTFDTTLFRETDLVTTVGLIPAPRDYPLDRLFLTGRRFPSRKSFPYFMNRLQNLTEEDASITICTTNTPNDDVVGTLHAYGFHRAYLYLGPNGKKFDMYSSGGRDDEPGRRFLIGFLVPSNVPEEENEDDALEI